MGWSPTRAPRPAAAPAGRFRRPSSGLRVDSELVLSRVTLPDEVDPGRGTQGPAPVAGRRWDRGEAMLAVRDHSPTAFPQAVATLRGVPSSALRSLASPVRRCGRKDDGPSGARGRTRPRAGDAGSASTLGGRRPGPWRECAPEKRAEDRDASGEAVARGRAAGPGRVRVGVRRAGGRARGSRGRQQHLHPHRAPSSMPIGWRSRRRCGRSRGGARGWTFRWSSTPATVSRRDGTNYVVPGGPERGPAGGRDAGGVRGRGRHDDGGRPGAEQPLHGDPAVAPGDRRSRSGCCSGGCGRRCSRRPTASSVPTSTTRWSASTTGRGRGRRAPRARRAPRPPPRRRRPTLRDRTRRRRTSRSCSSRRCAGWPRRVTLRADGARRTVRARSRGRGGLRRCRVVVPASGRPSPSPRPGCTRLPVPPWPRVPQNDAEGSGGPGGMARRRPTPRAGWRGNGTRTKWRPSSRRPRRSSRS